METILEEFHRIREISHAVCSTSQQIAPEERNTQQARNEVGIAPTVEAPNNTTLATPPYWPSYWSAQTTNQKVEERPPEIPLEPQLICLLDIKTNKISEILGECDTIAEAKLEVSKLNEQGLPAFFVPKSGYVFRHWYL